MSLNNKRILLGISGGIAAYKCADLTRLFVKAGAEVQVVMTPAATEFITPLTLQALSGNRVHLTLLDTEAEAAMGHIELARWADLIVVAPASADFIARMAGGQANDLLSTLLLATSSPIVLAPAMNQAMWADAATAKNVAELIEMGHVLLGPGAGEQACGDVGLGRMLEPGEILQYCQEFFDTGELDGAHVVITGGPTREAIDPVRYISNHSSGKMAYALANAAVDAGARVTLVSGPVNLAPPDHVETVAVVSAIDMLEATMSACEGADIFIGVAAVADYRPELIAEEKIKKHDSEMLIKLVKNPDIIAEVAQRPDRPLVVGFAAETNNIIANGQEKLRKKKLDLLFANNATETFNSDAITVIAISDPGEQQIGPASKSGVAREMISRISARLREKSPGKA